MVKCKKLCILQKKAAMQNVTSNANEISCSIEAHALQSVDIFYKSVEQPRNIRRMNIYQVRSSPMLCPEIITPRLQLLSQIDILAEMLGLTTATTRISPAARRIQLVRKRGRDRGQKARVGEWLDVRRGGRNHD